jgi:hypothetical protein
MIHINQPAVAGTIPTDNIAQEKMIVKLYIKMILGCKAIGVNVRSAAAKQRLKDIQIIL